jgi:hypothetical protein
MLDHRAKLAELRAAIARHQSAPLRSLASLMETGLSPLDLPLAGGLPKGGIVELVCPAQRAGASTMMASLLRYRASHNQWSALIDGGDQFDVQSAGAIALSRLLWVRCHNAREAFRAADLLLRDANLPLILFDIRGCPEKELRKVPSTTWYRFQRILEPTTVAFLVLTPSPQIPCAIIRLEVDSTFGLEAMEEESESLVMRCHVSASRHAKVNCS